MDRHSGFVFEPSVLRWAREEAEWSVEVLTSKLEASSKDIDAATIRKWENGTESPTFAQVKRLAELYKRPLAVFLLTSPPGEGVLPPDRRTIGSHVSRVFSSDALLAIRRARRVQQLASELDEELGIKRPFKYQKYRPSDPVSLARTIRADLGVSVAEQFRLRSYGEFFEHLRDNLESTGVITLRSGGHNSFPTQDARALSFADVEPYVILINNHDAEGAKNFSLLHEFAHILVRQAGICNNFTSFATNHGRVDTLEVFCNQFAASFLVPDEPFLAHRALRGKERVARDELDATVRPIASDFKVSRFVILRKLLAAGLISSDSYKAKADEWETEPIPKKGGGRSVPPKTAILNNGSAFSSLVFDAYKREKLSYAAASDYLGMKAKHMPAFEALMQTHGG